MANNLYRKQKRQYSTDNGVTWKDVTPPVYQVGALIEENSDCSTEAGSIQYRWFSYDISDNYTCDTTSHTKYNLEVLQYSYDGRIWQNTTETRRGSQMESNSCDCGYTEYRWNLIPGRYVCGTEDFSKYGVEVHQVGCGDNWQNVEPYEERVTDLPIECFSLDCGAESNQLAFTWDKRISTSAQINYNGTDYTFYNSDGVVSTDMHTIGICSLTDTSFMFNRSGYKNPYLTITKLPDTYYVTNMEHMFYGCSGLTELNVSDLRTDNVTNMFFMFYDCEKLNELDVTNFNTSNVANMESMFGYCFKLTSLDLSGWDTSNVSTMNNMFVGCSGLTELDLSNWKTDSLINMGSMFYGCSGLTYLDLSGWDVTNVTDMSYMLYNCSNLRELNLSGWDIQNSASIGNMFYGCTSLETIILNDVDCDTYNLILDEIPNSISSNVALISNSVECYNTNTFKFDSPSSDHCNIGINNNFYQVYRFTEYQYSGFTNDTFVNASHFLDGTRANNGHITNVIKMFDTSNVTDMSYMFYEMRGLKGLGVAILFDTSNVTDMSYMFYNCYNLTSLNVSNWDISKVTNAENMFKYCSKLSKLIIANDYDWWYQRLVDAGIQDQVTIKEV